jgi:hypothetical protein
MFTKRFIFATAGNFIECAVDGFVARATIHNDDCGDRPDERDDGFWPSLSPDDCGYVGEVSGVEFKCLYSAAEDRMEAWRNDDWRYVGIDVTIWRGSVQLTTTYANALWGIESDAGSYLTEVANDLLPDAMLEARAIAADIASVAA